MKSCSFTTKMFLAAGTCALGAVFVHGTAWAVLMIMWGIFTFVGIWDWISGG